MTTQVKNINDLFLEQLRDRYNAAKQQAEAYPKLKDHVSDTDLAHIIAKDIDSNNNHIANVKKLFDELGESPEGEQCEGTQGLIYEANELLSYAEQSSVLDIAIAISIQHINHHDIAGYRSCQLFAETLGKSELANTLGIMLADEKSTDQALEQSISKLLAQ